MSRSNSSSSCALIALSVLVCLISFTAFVSARPGNNVKRSADYTDLCSNAGGGRVDNTGYFNCRTNTPAICAEMCLASGCNEWSITNEHYGWSEESVSGHKCGCFPDIFTCYYRPIA